MAQVKPKEGEVYLKMHPYPTVVVITTITYEGEVMIGTLIDKNFNLVEEEFSKAERREFFSEFCVMIMENEEKIRKMNLKERKELIARAMKKLNPEDLKEMWTEIDGEVYPWTI
jgi:hypothetical protein